MGMDDGNSSPGQVSRAIRRYLLERAGHACEKCGWAVVHPITGRVPLTINHKDGDWNNTSPNNVEVLCPNCHSLTENYGALNKGRSPANRRRGINRTQKGAVVQGEDIALALRK